MESKVHTQELNRFGYIDMLRGFGIISVVFAHVFVDPTEFNNSSLPVKIIYMFHMPLFFFITGFLSSVRSNYRAFFVEKFTQLIIPYFIYFAIVFILQRHLSKDPIGLFTSLAYGGRHLYGYLGVFWFVPCLFMTQQFTNYLISRFARRNNFIILSACLLIGYVNDWYFQDVIIPYNINVVFAAAPFYFCGHLYKNHINNWHIPIAVPIAMLGICFVVFGHENYVDMKGADYGIFLLTFFSGLALILVLVNFFMKLPAMKFLSETGKSSLTIMYLHQPFQLFIFDNLTIDPTWRFLAGTILPIFVFQLAQNWHISRALLLGSKRDMNAAGMWLRVK